MTTPFKFDATNFFLTTPPSTPQKPTNKTPSTPTRSPIPARFNDTTPSKFHSIEVPDSEEKIKQTQKYKDLVDKMVINTGDSRGKGWIAARREKFSIAFGENVEHMEALSEVINNLTEAHEEERRDFLHAIREREQSIAQMQANERRWEERVNELSVTNDALVNQRCEAEKRTQASEKLTQELIAQRNETTMRIQTQNGLFQECKRANEEFAKQNAKLQQNIQESEARLKALGTKNEELVQRTCKLEQTVQEREGRIRELSLKNEEANAKKEDLELRLRKSEQQTKDISIELSAQKMGLDFHMQTSKRRIDEISVTNEKLVAQISEMEKRISALSIERDELATQKSDLERRTRASEKQVLDLTELQESIFEAVDIARANKVAVKQERETKKKETKKATKKESKDETKSETNSETKSETKNETKNETKEEVKNETKNERKNETKEETKNETKNETKKESEKALQ